MGYHFVFYHIMNYRSVGPRKNAVYRVHLLLDVRLPSITRITTVAVVFQHPDSRPTHPPLTLSLRAQHNSTVRMDRWRIRGLLYARHLFLGRFFLLRLPAVVLDGPKYSLSCRGGFSGIKIVDPATLTHRLPTWQNGI